MDRHLASYLGIPCPAATESVRKTVRVGSVRSAMSGNQPGNWSSNHRLESEKFTGWHYVACRAIALQAAQATVCVYNDAADPTGGTAYKMRRAEIRRIHGSVAKSLAAAPNEPAATPLPESHRLARLYKRPNPWQSGASFRYEQALQLSLTGVCLVVKIPNAAGLTVERYVVPTAIANPVTPCRGLPNGGYRIDPLAARNWAAVMDAEGFTDMRGFYRLLGATIPVEWFVTIRWPHPLFKDDGQSPVSAGALWADTANMTDKSRWAHLKNGPSPSLVVTAPEDSSPTEDELMRASQRFNDKYAGSENHGKAIFVAAGSVTDLSTTPKDMVYGEAFLQLRDAILALHGTPPLAAGIESATGREGLYAPLLQFSLLTVQPMLSFIAEEETIQQAPEFGKGLTVEMEAATVDDPAMQESALATDISCGARTINEVRAMRGLKAVPWGEVRATAGGAAAPGSSPGMPAADGTAGITGSPDDPTGAASASGGEFGGLNRRQWQNNIKGIRDVVGGLKDGTFTETAAVVMLTSLGLSQENAQRLIDDAKDGQVDEPENAELLNGDGSGNPKTVSRINLNYNGNGHANGHAKTDDDWLALAVARAWRRQ